MTNSLPSGTILKGEAATYIIKRVLGQGGFGITYLTEIYSKNANSMHLQFAIKEFYAQDFCRRNGSLVEIIKEEKIVSVLKERFQREAERISSFNHPNIVKTQEIFEANNTVYYAMQYLSCGSLENKKFLSEDKAIQYIRPIALVLRDLHMRKINHLDIKPDNIMLNEQEQPVLIDFGISKGYLEDGRSTSVQQVSALSPGYAPPEQYGNGARSFSPQLDIYALGATLYRLVTGQTPPISTELHDLDLHLLFPSSVSSQMQKLIKIAMQPDPWKRPESMEQYIKDIDLYTSSLNKGQNQTYLSDNGATRIESVTQTPQQVYQYPLQNGPTVNYPTQPATDSSRTSNKNTWVVAMAIIVLLGLGGFYFINQSTNKPDTQKEEPAQQVVAETNKPTPQTPTTTEKQRQKETSPNTRQSSSQVASSQVAPSEETSSKQSSKKEDIAPASKPAEESTPTPTVSAPVELSADELLQKGLSAYKKFDYKDALKYFWQASNKGNLVATYHLANMLYNGNGVAKNFLSAKTYFMKAAERGNKDAQYMLGVMYRNGQGGDKDIQQAKAWLQKAANQGHSKAKRLLDSL